MNRELNIYFKPLKTQLSIFGLKLTLVYHVYQSKLVINHTYFKGNHFSKVDSTVPIYGKVHLLIKGHNLNFGARKAEPGLLFKMSH